MPLHAILSRLPVGLHPPNTPAVSADGSANNSKHNLTASHFITVIIVQIFYIHRKERSLPEND